APTPIHPLSLHDALPISSRYPPTPASSLCLTCRVCCAGVRSQPWSTAIKRFNGMALPPRLGGISMNEVNACFCHSAWSPYAVRRSEEHTSELQSRFDLVC